MLKPTELLVPDARSLPRRPRLRRRVPRNPQSPAAIYERRYRERKARGAIVVQWLVVSPAALDGLVKLGWLRAADRADREKVADALVRFCRHALVNRTRAAAAEHR